MQTSSSGKLNTRPDDVLWDRPYRDLAPPPRALHIPQQAAELEQAVVDLAVLRARLAAQPYLDEAGALVQKADILFAERTNGSELDLIDLLGAFSGPAPLLPRLIPTLNHVNALVEGLAVIGTDPAIAYSAETLQSLHESLTAGMAVRGRRGEFRPVGVILNGPAPSVWPTLRPLPPDARACMAMLGDFLSNPPSMPLVQRLAITFGQIEMIEPFEYGSFLISNIVTQMVLTSEGYPIVPMLGLMTRDRRDYEARIAALCVTGDWDAWISVFIKYLAAGLHVLSAFLDRLLAHRAAWMAAMKHLRSDAAAWLVIDGLLVRPVLDVLSVQRSTGLSYKRANDAVATLVERKIIEPAPSSRIVRRNRLFVAGDVIRSLVDLVRR